MRVSRQGLTKIGFTTVSRNAVHTMTESKFSSWTFFVDNEATKVIYDSVMSGGAEKCACLSCRNYVQQRGTLYSPVLSQFFKDVGIDYRKDYEVIDYGPEQEDVLLYCTWFDFVGSIQSGPDLGIEFKQIDERFWVNFTENGSPTHSHFYRKGLKVVTVSLRFLLPIYYDEI